MSDIGRRKIAAIIGAACADAAGKANTAKYSTQYSAQAINSCQFGAISLYCSTGFNTVDWNRFGG